MDRSPARCFQAGSSLGLVTGGSDDCRVGRTWLDSTGERRDIGVLDPPHVRRVGDCNFLTTRIVFSRTRVWKRNRKSRTHRPRESGKPSFGSAVQLTFDADVEAFRAEFIAFLDAHLPAQAEAVERPRSSSHIPAWARNWQRL